ncbi:MAG: family 1 encapsulin nanocompartment shell protein [Tissierellia bacterium]|nr:family 1 encapsulin nanocompartment shell protein [Tissierellia bacterium]
MDILKRSIAPISEEAWEEIDETAKDVLTSILSARKTIKINGPKGWDYNAVSEGRLEIIDEGDVNVGQYKLKRLVEPRINFELDKWELDNIERGAKDLDLEPLEKACEKIAVFEDNLIYNGYKPGDIEGLADAAKHQMAFGKEPNTILKNIGEAKFKLFNAYVKPPYNLMVSKEAYERINKIFEGANLIKQIENLIQGKVIRSKAVKGAILVPHRDDDLELTIGQDFSIGYESHDSEKIQMYVTETLTFRVLDEAKVVNFSLS